MTGTNTLTHSCLQRSKLADYFGDISLAKAIFRKLFKEKYKLEHYHQLSFKYFAKSFSISKLLSKVLQAQTILSGGTPKHEWVKLVPKPNTP